MNKTRFISALLASLMLLGTLTACGTPTEEPAVTNGVTAGNDATETELATLWLIHVDVWQKPTQYCKSIITQLKINFKNCYNRKP